MAVPRIVLFFPGEIGIALLVLVVPGVDLFGFLAARRELLFLHFQLHVDGLGVLLGLAAALLQGGDLVFEILHLLVVPLQGAGARRVDVLLAGVGVEQRVVAAALVLRLRVALLALGLLGVLLRALVAARRRIDAAHHRPLGAEQLDRLPGALRRHRRAVVLLAIGADAAVGLR